MTTGKQSDTKVEHSCTHTIPLGPIVVLTRSPSAIAPTKKVYIAIVSQWRVKAEEMHVSFKIAYQAGSFSLLLDRTTVEQADRLKTVTSLAN